MDTGPAQSGRRGTQVSRQLSTQASPGAEAAARPAWLDLAPVARVGGVVRMPGSKSISNRLLLLSALAAKS